MDKKTIGRIDRVDFIDQALNNVKSKIDSGAYYSAIHCDLIKVYKYAGKEKLKVIFLDPQNEAYTGKQYVFEHFSIKSIKSSNGIMENRYVVEMNIKIFNQLYRSFFSLTNREMLKYPVLLGRELLNDNFIIDTSKSNLSYKLKENL